MSERSEHLSWLRNSRFLCVEPSCKTRNVPYQSDPVKKQKGTKLAQYGDVNPTWFYACPDCGSPLFMTVSSQAENKRLLIRRQQGALSWIRKNIHLNVRKKIRRERKKWHTNAAAVTAAQELKS